MIHLYAFMPRCVDLTDLLGIDDRPVRCLAVDDLAVAVSDHDEQPRPGEDNALAHHRVVTALAERGPATVPARFGMGFSDDRALIDALADRTARLHEAFALLGGRIEFLVRSGRRPAAATAPSRTNTTGRDYLADRLAQLRAEEAAAHRTARHLADVDAALGASAIAHLERTGPLGPEHCYLVDRAQATDFVQLATERIAETGSDTLVLGGPLPPYSFADLVVQA